MKTSELKQLIKEAVKEAFQEELKNILLEAIKSNKQPIMESNRFETSTGTNPMKFSDAFTTNQPKSPIEAKKKYAEILNDIAAGPKSSFDGEFRVTTADTISEGSALPPGQLPLSSIMNLIKK